MRGGLCTVVCDRTSVWSLLLHCFWNAKICFFALVGPPPPSPLLFVFPWICTQGPFSRCSTDQVRLRLHTSPHLEKKHRWPADELSPSYESLCLRLSGGRFWLCPSLGAEISMLLLLSLLLELRPGLDSPCKPELSWEKEGDESKCKHLLFFTQATTDSSPQNWMHKEVQIPKN